MHFAESQEMHANFKRLLRANAALGRQMTRFQHDVLKEVDKYLGDTAPNDQIKRVHAFRRFEQSLASIERAECDCCHEKWFDMGIKREQVPSGHMVQTGLRQGSRQEMITVNQCSKCRTEREKNAKFDKHGVGMRISDRGWENDMDPGPVPAELQCLNEIESRLIARVITFVAVKRLPSGSIGYMYTGHSIHYRQDITSMANALTKLPRRLDDCGTCLLSKVSRKDGKPLRGRGKPHFTVNRWKILKALQWLKDNNPAYFDIEIDHGES